MLARRLSVNRSNSGFTLIEIILVITVMSTLTTFTFAGFNDISRQQYLREASEEMKTNLRFFYTNTINGIKPGSCDQLLYHKVFFDFANNSYQDQVWCQQVASPGVPVLKKTQTYTLPRNISLSPNSVYIYTPPNSFVNDSTFTWVIYPDGRGGYETTLSSSSASDVYFHINYLGVTSYYFRINICSSGSVFTQKVSSFAVTSKC